MRALNPAVTSSLLYLDLTEPTVPGLYAEANIGPTETVHLMLHRGPSSALALLRDPSELEGFARLHQRISGLSADLATGDFKTTQLAIQAPRQRTLRIAAGVAAVLTLSWFLWGLPGRESVTAAPKAVGGRLLNITVPETMQRAPSIISWSMRENLEATARRYQQFSFHHTHIVVTETKSQSL